MENESQADLDAKIKKASRAWDGTARLRFEKRPRRVIDLTPAAAGKLGFSSLTRVTLDVIEKR
jgi:hypothetical protein